MTACSESSVNKSKYLLSGYYVLGTMPGRNLSASVQLDEEWRHFHGLLFQNMVRLTKPLLFLWSTKGALWEGGKISAATWCSSLGRGEIKFRMCLLPKLVSGHHASCLM